jgi:hypothetical protein
MSRFAFRTTVVKPGRMPPARAGTMTDRTFAPA